MVKIISFFKKCFIYILFNEDTYLSDKKDLYHAFTFKWLALTGTYSTA